ICSYVRSVSRATSRSQSSSSDSSFVTRLTTSSSFCVTRRSSAPNGSFSNIARMDCSLPGSHLPRINSRTSLNNGAGGSTSFLFYQNSQLRRVDMVARSISFHLKPGRAAEFTQILDKDIIPVLRKQKGFQDTMALVAPGGADAVGISVWDLRENAETYARNAYAGVLKALEQVVDGTPRVQTYDVCNSTFHKTGAGVTA